MHHQNGLSKRRTALLVIDVVRFFRDFQPAGAVGFDFRKKLQARKRVAG